MEFSKTLFDLFHKKSIAKKELGDKKYGNLPYFFAIFYVVRSFGRVR
ncbi:hypothetical protein MNB_SM-7-749 [hydrothermal vent metagenome]|uniref:Uncharacterized protein n=1 Tax=hydrothermal vent metagenome TaxID=652676 RepID=A0A1W1C3U7_9ZZZZ